MPRRDILTAAQREELLAFPDDEGELIRLYTLSRDDLVYVRAHRGGHNRLGIAVQLCYLRFPGRTLSAGEVPFSAMLGIVAAQLGLAPALWDLYATRDETRREHVTELFARLGLESFSRGHVRNLVAWLTPLAMQTTQGLVLAQALVVSFGNGASCCPQSGFSSIYARKRRPGRSAMFIACSPNRWMPGTAQRSTASS